MSSLDGNIVLSPKGTIDLGDVVVGTTATVGISAFNIGGGNADLLALNLTGSAAWVLAAAPALPATIGPYEGVSCQVRFTPAAAGASSATLDTIDWGSVIINGNGVNPGTHIGAFNPASLTFLTPLEKGQTEDLVVVFKNAGTGDFTLTALNFVTGINYSLIAPPALPLLMHPGDTTNLTVRFAPIVAGHVLDTLHAVTDLAGTINLEIAGIAFLIFPIAICTNNDRRVIVSGYDADGLAGQPASLVSSPDNWDADQAGLIIPNGAIWQGLGVEKTLMRLGFYYENLGVAALTATLTVHRPSLGADHFEVYPFPLVLGTAAADGTTRYAEIDSVVTGEIITLQLSRASASGPVSLCGIVPYFEPRGEKVRNV